jgi:lysozyme family protein
VNVQNGILLGVLFAVLVYSIRDGFLFWLLIRRSAGGSLVSIPGPGPVPPIALPPPTSNPGTPPTPVDTGAQRFASCVALVLGYEGGNDDDPNDPGGRTSRGIIQSEWNVWRKTHPGLPSDVWQAPQDQVVAIYKQSYWDALSCSDLAPGLDLVTFDYGVNSGNSRSAKLLQQLVGSEVDGEVGPNTTAAAAKVTDVPGLINKFCDARLAFLQGLGTWSVFGKGWSSRVADVRKQALAMASGTAPASSNSVPTQLAVIRDLVSRGVHATHDNPEIMTWPAYIATQYPDMVAYCKQYTHDSIAWCGLTMAYCVARAGKRPPFNPAVDTESFLWAFAWKTWGTKVWDASDGVPISQAHPQMGDIVVFEGLAGAGSGHVTMYDHLSPNDDLFWCSGGNQGNHLCSTEGIRMSACVAIRRPPA